MSKTFIIAELSANHNHNLRNAVESIKAAAKIGVDAVKIQTYTADTLTLNCRNEYFVLKGGLWDGRSLYDLYQEAYTPWEWHEELFKVAREEGITIFSTPFDRTAVDLLESLGNPIYKIASFEIMDLDLINYAASKGKPMIMSTGIATENEISEAIEICRNVGNKDITLLKCTSEYPAKISDANLAMIPDMKARFGVNIGLSDHSIGSLVPIVAVALGASVVEKHFILDRNIGGPDAAFSMDIKEFSQLVNDIRKTESSIGTINYELTPSKINSRSRVGRSLFVSADIKKGEILTPQNIRCVRPGVGLHPRYLSRVLGKRVNKDLSFGTPLNINDIEF